MSKDVSYVDMDMSKDMDFVIHEKCVRQMSKNVLDTATKTGLDAAKTASKKVVHKAVEATRELIENKMAEKIVKHFILRRQKILNAFRQVI